MDVTSIVPFDGTLSKYTNVMKGWQNRFFILNPQRGVLEYFVSQSEAVGNSYKPRGSVMLTGAVIAPSTEDSYTFSVNAANGEVYRLRAINAKERQEWVARLRAVVQHFSTQIAQEHPPLVHAERTPRTRSVVTNMGNSFNKIKEEVPAGDMLPVANILSVNTHEYFRAGGPTRRPRAPGRQQGPYQVQHISGSLQGPPLSRNVAPGDVTKTSTADANAGRNRTESAGSYRRAALMRTGPVDVNRPLQSADLKQLQNAKQAIVSADNYHAGLINMLDCLRYHGEHKSDSDKADTISQASDEGLSALDQDVLLLKATSGAALQSLSSCYSILQKYHQQLYSALPPDAKVKWVEPKDRAYSASGTHSVDTASVNSDGKDRISFKTPSLADPSEEVEDVNDEVEDDLGAVDEHKSVIMHLLSQLKLGMDLTKVTLPTFILEKRSLLEMYADFIGHTDLLLGVGEGETPRERMHRALKFYLTSFHCGRQGHVAKKPYNPIVGEVFQCSYYTSRTSAAEPSANSNTSSSARVRTQFIAEQVSHHPPVSAFHVSCPDRNLTLTSHIWTRSKFMNMSIGVVNIGEGNLYLSDVKEKYVMTYPSAYARSILTVPWSELGGRCGITCEATGFTANITFHTKPMYGGLPHRVTAEVKDSSGFVSCRVQGKWNGELEFTYFEKLEEGDPENAASAPLSGRVEVIDCTKLQTFKKHLRPVDKQDTFESRKLWQNVTSALRVCDVTSATEHKSALEEQQRELEKQRSLAGLSVPVAYFVRAKGKDFDTYSFKQNKAP